jgi:hypothetical protein
MESNTTFAQNRPFNGSSPWPRLPRLQMLLGVLTLSWFGPALAQPVNYLDVNKTIQVVGSHAGASPVYYFRAVEALSNTGCLYGTLYIATNASQDAKAMYATLLAAKLTGRRLSRVDYSQTGGPGNLCFAHLVEVSD